MPSVDTSKKFKDLPHSGFYKNYAGDIYYIDIAKKIGWKITPEHKSETQLNHFWFTEVDMEKIHIAIPPKNGNYYNYNYTEYHD